MMEMCHVAGNKDQLINLLLPLMDHVLNIILIHFQDRYALLVSFGRKYYYLKNSTINQNTKSISESLKPEIKY